MSLNKWNGRWRCLLQNLFLLDVVTNLMLRMNGVGIEASRVSLFHKVIIRKGQEENLVWGSHVPKLFNLAALPAILKVYLFHRQRFHYLLAAWSGSPMSINNFVKNLIDCQHDLTLSPSSQTTKSHWPSCFPLVNNKTISIQI